MPAETGLLNFRAIARDTNPRLPSSDECVQAVLISLSASGLSESGESRNGWADKVDGNHAGCPTQSYSEHHSLNSLTNVEALGSFHDMVLLSLQYQGFPTQQPVQQHTEGPTYEVGDEPYSTHSERRRHLPTFQLMAGERPFSSFFLFFFFFNVISPCLVSALLPSCAMESRVSRATTQNQRSDACQPRLAAPHTPLLLQHAESTHRHALRHVPIARTHGKFGLVLRCLCAWLC